MISFRTVGAFFCKRCLKLYRPLWGEKEEGREEEEEEEEEGGGDNSCTV